MLFNLLLDNEYIKVNSVQEACPYCFAIHLLRFEILQTTCKNQKPNQKHQNAKSIDEKLKTKGLEFFVLFFFHVISKNSKFNMWTAKHLA